MSNARLNPLQLAYEEPIGVDDDAILYMRHWAYSHLDEPGSYMRIMLFDRAHSTPSNLRGTERKADSLSESQMS